MKRAHLVLGATAAGLVGVLSYHTAAPSSLGISAAGAAGSSGTSTGTNGSTTTSPPTTVGGTATSSPPTTAAPTTTTTGGTQTLTGTRESYAYGILQLRVTVTAGKITAVTPVVDEAADPRSAQINAYAINILRQQALAAQSANINGVSGATYTSQAYAYSLQGALDQLHK